MTDTSPKTFGEALDRINGLQDKISIYDDLTAYLTPFISTDSHVPEKGVKSPVHPDEPVGEGTIIEVQKELGLAVTGMNKEIARLRGMGLSGKAKKVLVKKVRAKKAPVKKARAKRAPPKRRIKK